MTFRGIYHRSDSNQCSDYTTSLISGFTSLKCVFGEELLFLSKTIFRYKLCLRIISNMENNKMAMYEVFYMVMFSIG